MSLRCVSSHLTTALLEFRNPQGTEENWIGNEERIDDYLFHGAKIITTEIAATILVLTATVECVVYGILAAVTLTALPFSNKPLNFCCNMFASSAFTTYWNVGNVLVFNFGCINAVTHESFARFSIDHWPRGSFFKMVLSIVNITLTTLFILTRTGTSVQFLNEKMSWTRTEDYLYIADWVHNHQIPINALNPPLLQDIVRHGAELNNAVVEGKRFFQNYIVREGQIDPSTLKLILELDPDSYSFVLTRSAYLYVFGTKKSDILPSFFKAATNICIHQLRLESLLNPGMHNVAASLEPLMRDQQAFLNGPEDGPKKVIFNKLREVAYKELQGSIFLARCWS